MPGLRFVIDHLAKPPIASRALQPWASLIAPFGTLDHVTCKVSGMVTEADFANWTVDDLRPYVDHVLATFGPNRLLYGSDWPVCLAAASYARVIGAASEMAAALAPAERERFFGGTAREVYQLG